MKRHRHPTVRLVKRCGLRGPQRRHRSRRRRPPSRSLARKSATWCDLCGQNKTLRCVGITAHHPQEPFCSERNRCGRTTLVAHSQPCLAARTCANNRRASLSYHTNSLARRSLRAYRNIAAQRAAAAASRQAAAVLAATDARVRASLDCAGTERMKIQIDI